MHDFKDICADIADKYPLCCEVEEYYQDKRITKATFRVVGVGKYPAWATITVPTNQAGDALVKRLIRAHVLTYYAMYGGDELRDEVIASLKAISRDARRNHSLSWVVDRAESLQAGLTEPVENSVYKGD